MLPLIRVGPAGNPVGYRGSTVNVFGKIRAMGLDAYEYQATYGLRLKNENAVRIHENSVKNDVLVSMHGPYYINLSSAKKETVEKSIERLFDCVVTGKLMGAYRIVFHPGFYGEQGKAGALDLCRRALGELIERLHGAGIREFTLAPETTGKRSQVGSLDEIIKLSEEFDEVMPTIDFAHIHARGGGCIRDARGYMEILDRVESRLGSHQLHCHFTGIEYTDAGERKHHSLSEGYGPPVEPLIEVLVDGGWEATIISETPMKDADAMKIKAIINEYLKRE
ncbi:deoxyribonuclease IV [Methanothermobacter thermautotrophicus]|uniref:deoxyribonuclease IV n=1 Tax=Methanothermobacter thermautotrophicus TaxID=145262 RepID=UPI0029FEF1CA|nr:deoxyribonuclease IV [Methanothermobacter thermautotrophicus]